MSKTILIIDLYSAANRGDAAILEGLISSLKRQAPDSQFIIHTWFPAQVKSDLGAATRLPLIMQFLGDYRSNIKTVTICSGLMLCSVLARFGLDLYRILPRRYRESFVDFLAADLIVGMGGGFYNDNYWVALPGRLCHLIIGKLLGKFVAISAHSFGPFHRKLAQLLAHYVFNWVDVICVRDEASLAILKSLNVADNKVHKVADSAWLLDSISKEEANSLLAQQGIDADQPLLVSVSGRIWPYYRLKGNNQGHQNYIEAVVAVLNFIIEKYHGWVVFLSTCYDDRQVGFEIKQRLQQPDRFCIASEAYEAKQLKGLYGLMDFHIGTRMHSIILALSKGTPCIGISYEPKLFSLMTELELEGFVTDIEVIEALKVEKMVDKIVKDRQRYQAVIDQKLPELQQQAQENARIIAGLLAKPI